MRFKDITSITGLSGLFKMENQKPSGVIVTSLSEGWTKFVSSREHLFSPLENISIYSSKDTIDLLDVMLMAYNQRDTNPPVDPKSDNKTLSAYFEKVLPDYDKEKVHISDIKKFVKWFVVLDEKGVLKTEAEEKEKEEKEKTKDEEIASAEETEETKTASGNTEKEESAEDEEKIEPKKPKTTKTTKTTKTKKNDTK